MSGIFRISAKATGPAVGGFAGAAARTSRSMTVSANPAYPCVQLAGCALKLSDLICDGANRGQGRVAVLIERNLVFALQHQHDGGHVHAIDAQLLDQSRRRLTHKEAVRIVKQRWRTERAYED